MNSKETNTNPSDESFFLFDVDISKSWFAQMEEFRQLALAHGVDVQAWPIRDRGASAGPKERE